jgi:uncharacterized RDD family membrane protein YckC
MTWYYVKDGAASGPISDDDFASQLRLGYILPTTLVWRSGMVEWQAASSVADEVASRTATPVAPAPAHVVYPMAAALAGPASTTPPVLPGFFCTYCGNIIPADQLVRIGGRNVCAACKPRYVQQVSEGLAAPVKVPVLGGRTAAAPESDLADPGLRLVGYILDLLFIMVPMVIGYFVVAAIAFGVLSAGRRGGSGETFGIAMMIVMMSFAVLAFVWYFFYWTYFIGKRGATPGMKIMKVKMVRADRSPVAYSRVLGRALLLYVINGCTMGLTNITAFFDSEKRTVVDMLCDTRVVRNDN